MSAVFGISGVCAGLAQVWLLLRSAQGSVGPFALLLRLGLVAAVLVTAVLFGFLQSAAGGWLAGYLVAVIVGVRRLR